jgi:hypothetical protein
MIHTKRHLKWYHDGEKKNRPKNQPTTKVYTMDTNHTLTNTNLN